MAENKKAVILYVDIISTFEALSDDEAGRLIKHYLRYVNDMNPEPPDRITQIAFEPIKQQLKRDLVKWEEIKGKRSKAGKASAESRKHTSTNSTSVKSVKQAEHTSTNSTVSVNDTVSVTVSVSDKEKIFERFWKVYPKKKSKGTAEKAWRALNPSNTLVDTMVEAVEKLKNTSEWKKDNGQYIPYPATWLNAKGWLDVPDAEIDKSKLTITPEQRDKLMTE